MLVAIYVNKKKITSKLNAIGFSTLKTIVECRRRRSVTLLFNKKKNLKYFSLINDKMALVITKIVDFLKHCNNDISGK